MVFVSGDQPGQVAVSPGLKGFRAGAVIAQAGASKDAQAVAGLQAGLSLGPGIYLRTVFDFKFVECGEGNNVTSYISF